MYKVVKATLLLKKSLRKRVADKEYSKNTVYLQHVETYKIFSPRTLHALLLTESFAASIIKPISKRIFGAVLFADISGFTRLSARLDSEELKLHINLYFSLVLGVVDKYSGDVIKFCGDAIIVLWPLDQNSDFETQCLVIELAIKCSLQLLRVCGRYDKNLSNDRPPVSLRLHCGVACGYIHSMCLGAGDRWEFLIAGPPLKQVGIAASEAGIGEVCISREVEDFLPDTFQLERMPLGSYKILGFRTHTRNELSSSFFAGEYVPDAIRKTSSGTNPVRSPAPDSSDTTGGGGGAGTGGSGGTGGGGGSGSGSERKSPSLGSIAVAKGLSGRFILNLQKQKEITPEPRNSGPGNRSLVIAAAQMAAIWTSAQDSLNTRASRRRSATIAPTIEDNPDITRHSQTIAYLDAPDTTDVHKSLLNNLPPLSHDHTHHDSIGYAKRLRFFVHEGARDAIEQNCLSYLAELRLVVTMFIEILDLEVDFTQGLLHRPQYVICTILNCLIRYGGSLRQYVIDDKGCIVICNFGLSGSSHEDNSIRAIETALRVKSLLNSEGIAVRFGITSGRVFCGLVGTGERCDYAMMGSSVNLAARFMANAPANEMIVSHEIYLETFHEFEYNHLTKIHAKGYDNPVPAYTPTKRIAGTLTKKLNTTHSLFELKDINFFIGRNPALAALQGGYKSFKEESSTTPIIYSILAPPGYGKTWLLNKFLTNISEDITSLSSSASSSASVPPSASSSSSSSSSVPPSASSSSALASSKKKIYTIVGEELNVNKRYHCLRILFDQIFRYEFEKNTSIQDFKILLSQSSSQSIIQPTTKLRKMTTISRSMMCSTVEEDTVEFTSMFKKWLEINCPKLMMKDLNIGREIYESDAGRRKFSPPTDEIVADRGVTEVLSRHTLITDLLPCLEGILPVETSFSPIISSMSHWARIKLSHQIILRVLEVAIFNKGVIFTLENLEWCDTTTLDILHLLFTTRSSSSASSSSSSSAFCVVTARSIGQDHSDIFNQPSPALGRSSLPPSSSSSTTTTHINSSTNTSSRLCRSAQLLIKLSNKVTLEPFHTNDIKEMIEMILTQQHLPSEYQNLLSTESLTQIHQRTGGVPYLTSSLMLSLRESIAHNNFHGIESLPTGEHNIIVNRFDKLTSTEQLILKVATVIGDTFNFDFLAQVLKCMGDGLVSASVGLDSTLQRLQSSSLVVQVPQENIKQQPFSRYGSEEILPYDSYISDNDDPISPHSHSHSHPPSAVNSLVFQFTARNIKDCIYNLMLQSQRESVHAIVGRLLERQWGTLPELNFFEIASHYYSSNNFQKKILYLEESLRRAQGDHDTELMKDSLHHLLQITVGYTGDALIQHCFSTNRKKERSNQFLFPFNQTIIEEEPILSTWLTTKNIQHSITLLEGINQTQSEKAITDPFAVSYHDREIPSKDSSFILPDKSLTTPSRSLTSSPIERSGKNVTKIIAMKNVLSWISQLANVLFGLGNFKQTNSLGLLFLNEIELTIPKPQNYYNNVTDLLYQWRGCFRFLHSSIIFTSPEYSRYSFKTILPLIQIHLLRGQPAPADDYLFLLSSMSSAENQSPSDLFELKILSHFLSFLKGEKSLSILDSYNSFEPNEESLFQSSSIGLYYLLKGIVELSAGESTKSLLSSRNSLSHYEKSHNTLFTYGAMVLRGWCHLFACRLDDSLQIASDSALYATISQGIPLALHKWAVQVLIVSKLLRGDVSGAYTEWEKLQPIARSELFSSTSCALYSILSTYRGLFIESVPYCRHACMNLSEKQIITPMSALFLFYSGYAALRIVEFCKMEINPIFRQQIEMGYERLEIPYATILHMESPSKKKLNEKDYRSIIDLLLPCVNLVIRRFHSSQKSNHIARLFGQILLFMKKRIISPNSNQLNSYHSLVRQYSSYDNLPLYYLYYEAAIYFSSREQKQAHVEAFHSYEMAKKLIPLPNQIQSGSDYSASPALSHNTGKYTDVQEFLASDQLLVEGGIEGEGEGGGDEANVLDIPIRKKKNESRFLAQINESINESMTESKEERFGSGVISIGGRSDEEPMILQSQQQSQQSQQSQLKFQFGNSSSSPLKARIKYERVGNGDEVEGEESKSNGGLVLTQFE